MIKNFHFVPKFWEKKNLLSQLLSPLGQIYHCGTQLRQKLKTSSKVSIPVICIGNLTVGGSGKTPTALEIARFLKSKGCNPHFISKGYGRQQKGIIFVTPHHSAYEVGDEPLLLLKEAPVWVSESRYKAACVAEKNGATHLILDDGFQDPELFKDFSFCVINSNYAFGNGFVLPAGPLREYPKEGLQRAQAIFWIGNRNTNLFKELKLLLPIVEVQIKIDIPTKLNNQKVIAFAGIAYPERFFDLLEKKGLVLVDQISFPDHAFYTQKTLEELQKKAQKEKAWLVTTEKDFVRLSNLTKEIISIPMRLEIQNKGLLENLMSNLIHAQK